MDRSFTGTHLLVAALGGAAAGAAVALLTAPRTGKETRDLIAARAREGKDALIDKSRRVRERLAHPMKSENVPPTIESAYHAAAIAAQEAFIQAFDARTQDAQQH